MRTWAVGDSIVNRAAGQSNPQLNGDGVVLWKGLPGAKCAGVVNRLIRLLQKNPFPTTIILHLGTNNIFKGSQKEILKRLRENLLGIRKLLPNIRLIWSDVLVRVGYSEEQNAGAGKKVMRHINKAAHKCAGRN